MSARPTPHAEPYAEPETALISRIICYRWAHGCGNALTASPQRIRGQLGNLPRRRSMLPPILPPVGVVKWHKKGPSALGHHVQGVVPAGDRAFNHRQWPEK